MTHPNQLLTEIEDAIRRCCCGQSDFCCPDEESVNAILALIDKARKEAVEEYQESLELHHEPHKGEQSPCSDRIGCGSVCIGKCLPTPK